MALSLLTLDPDPLGEWPSLKRVPDPGHAAEIASTLRRACGLRQTSRLDLDRLCRCLDVEISVAGLDVPGGGAQGFLMPKPNGGFRIEVDPEPRRGWRGVPPTIRKTLARHRKRFLVAHEVAHTLFYENGPEGPRRRVYDSEPQEQFCDELARTLLVPTAASITLPFTPGGIVEAQRRFDVSMQVAVRGMVAARPKDRTAWLLLQRGDQTLVQWGPTDRHLTRRLLGELRKLVAHAFDSGAAEAPLREVHRRAHALHLPDREQVVVTLDAT
jgi:hypothetical protein